MQGFSHDTAIGAECEVLQVCLSNNRRIVYTIYHIPYTIYHIPYTIYHIPCTIYYLYDLYEVRAQGFGRAAVTYDEHECHERP